jgi:hypothetical protein
MCLADAVGEERAEQIVLLDAVVEGVEKPAKDDVAPGLLLQGRLIAHRQPPVDRVRVVAVRGAACIAPGPFAILVIDGPGDGVIAHRVPPSS